MSFNFRSAESQAGSITWSGWSLVAGYFMLLALLSMNSLSVTDLSFFVSDVVTRYHINTQRLYFVLVQLYSYFSKLL